MSDNAINQNIYGDVAAAPGKALSDALVANTVLTELNLSSNYLKPEFARELSIGISGNGALTTLDISSNHIGAEQEGGLQRICVAGGIELAISKQRTRRIDTSNNR
jgi:hypothetical protein